MEKNKICDEIERASLSSKRRRWSSFRLPFPKPSPSLPAMKTQDNPVASTSTSALPTQNPLKRKTRDDDDEGEEGEQQQDDNEKEDPSFADEVAASASSKVAAPVKKKAKKEKKPLVKKVAVWNDIKTWKEGDDPLGSFPIEVLDMVSFSLPHPPPPLLLGVIWRRSR